MDLDLLEICKISPQSIDSVNELKERLKECFDIICINKNINTESSLDV